MFLSCMYPVHPNFVLIHMFCLFFILFLISVKMPAVKSMEEIAFKALYRRVVDHVKAICISENRVQSVADFRKELNHDLVTV